MYIGLISGICSNPYLFCFECVVGAICCPGIFENWNIIATKIFYSKKSTKSDQGCRGEAKIGPRGYPQRFGKTGREKDALPDESAMQMVPTWEPTSESLAYVG